MDRSARRLEILRAARRIFATRGYHDTKVDDIVAEARVAKGTFYLYFPDKRSIFVELVDTLFTQIGAAILRVDTAGDVAAQVRHNIRAILDVLLDEPETTQILLSHAAGLDPSFATKISAFYGGVKKMFAESLRDGQRQGIVAAGDAALFATFSVGAIKEAMLELTEGGDSAQARARTGEAIYALLEHGYLRVAARRKRGEAPKKATRKKIVTPKGDGAKAAGRTPRR